MKCTDQVVLATGASSGLGRELALGCARAGARVCLSGRDPERLAAVQAAIAQAGGVAAVHAADLLRPEARRELVAACRRQLGPVDVLLHAAGVLAGGAHDDLGEADVRAMTAINLEAPMHLSALVLPEMKQRRRGALVLIASMSARLPVPFTAAYAATKAGLAAFAHALAGEVAPDGIQVLLALPGATDTPMLQGRDERAREELGIELADPRQVAASVLRALLGGRRVVFPRRGARLEAMVATLFPGLVNRAFARRHDALRRYFGA